MANDSSKKGTWTNDGASGIAKANTGKINLPKQSGNSKPSGEKPKS